jgi:hypothetical protein
MCAQMIALRSEQLKVFWAIVILDSVDVVNDFTWRERATNHTLHHHPMLQDIPAAIGPWVHRIQDNDISVA